MSRKLQIGIDIGGTFTDAVAVHAGGVSTAKVPSDPANPARAVMAAIDALQLPETPQRFLHGTTLVTNMLLERKGAHTGFITSQGMRDVVHIGRHERPLNYAIRQEIPQQHHPPVPRRYRLTVPERVSAQGEIVVPLDESAVRAAARRLASDGVRAIAIGFLHSYRYPDHELLAETWVHEEAPGVFVCTSQEVSPRFREYERFLTTAWNARVAPGAALYLKELGDEIDRRWPGIQLTLMTSNGGLEEVDLQAEAHRGDLRRTPVRLGLSGPAAAGNAVANVANNLGLRHCVGLDVGGTSSDIVVIRESRLNEAPWEERRIGGYPLQIPMLDLHTIGAGGGSLIHRDEFGALHVGPQSAGADPGPACYDRGGQDATVTDAAAFVGRLPADLLLGGTMPIRVELAQQALAGAFGVDGEALVKQALDVLALAEANIAFGIRERTVARGLDPSELALVAAGGAGPILACGIAEILELREIIVPPRPGLLAAWGLLVAPERREAAITVLKPMQTVSSSDASEYFERALKQLPDPQGGSARQYLTAALRYLGQGFEVEVEVDDPSDIQEIERRFHAAHEHEYGFSMPASPVEWVELRAAWEIAAQEWRFPDESVDPQGGEAQTPLWERRISPDGTSKVASVQASQWHRSGLALGDLISGPAIITEHDATTYIPTGWQGEITPGGYMRIRKIKATS